MIKKNVEMKIVETRGEKAAKGKKTGLFKFGKLFTGRPGARDLLSTG